MNTVVIHMTKYFIGILLSILMVIYGYVRIHKNRQSLEGIQLERYEKSEFWKDIIPWLIVLALFSVFCIYVAVKENNDNLLNVSMAVLVDFVVEIFVARKTMVLYHSKDRCIIEGKQVLYKNIKSCARRNKLPFSKGIVTLFTGDTKKVYPQAVDIINSHLNN